ncbi:MAG TPA: PA domain-containing protein [Candidatus Limnocylindrales bacterium]|nr:PA domain-containing protein [Candidatus Limnocylindrales bacterium]
MRSRSLLSKLTVGAVAVLVGAGIVSAAPPVSDGAVDHADGARDAHQHGETAGHLHPEGTSSAVELVSSLRLKNAVPEKIADVGVHDGYAYLAAWGVATCKYNGVHVVDIRNPARPKEVAFIVSKEGSYPGEGVQALRIDTAAFAGDILVTNNEKCKEPAGFGGMNIYDITRPTAPTPLAEGFGDATVPGSGKKAANEIHSVFAWDAGDRAYAVMVDNEEALDVDIVDISDPRKPAFIAEYDLADEFPQILQAAPDNLHEVFLHDMVVKEIDGRQIMLLSYWDAGYVALDVTDPLAPSYVGDTDFTDPDPEALESGWTVAPEGNGHQSEVTRDDRYLIGADEDFSPLAVLGRNLDDGTDLTVTQGSDTRLLLDAQVVEGPGVFVGRACNGDAAVPAGGAGVQVAVVERGLCTFSEKVANVIAAGGYEAVLIFNRVGTDGGCDGTLGMTVEGDIVTVGVAPRGEGFAIFDQAYDDAACLDGTGPARLAVALGTVGDTLRLTGRFDGWGYVHLFDYGSGKMAELDTFALPEAHDQAYVRGFGDLSVHEVATSHVRDDLAYLSYYSGGFRVLKITDDEKLAEVGHFIDVGGNNFWGVQVFQSGGVEYVAASDRDSGLYIFRYTGSE